MKKLMLLAAVAIIGRTTAQTAQFTINFFIQEYPEEQIKKPTINEAYGSKYAILKNAFHQPTNRGIRVAYNGFLADSDVNGLVSLPRKTQQEEFNLLITDSLKPVYGIQNLLQGWEITNPRNTAMFHIKRYQDEETDLYYWKVLETNLPSDSRVPIHTIVVIAQPNNIYIPLGITLTTKEPNLVLPPIYAKQSLDRIMQSLFVLPVKQFYRDVRMNTKTDPADKSALLVTP